MKLNISKRSGQKKSELSKIRHENNIPAVLYQRGKSGEKIVIDGAEYRAIIRVMKTGYISTTVFELDNGSKTIRAIIKEIQYHPTTYQVLHLDFYELADGVYIEVNIPVNCVGVADCAGIKLGGFLREVSRHVKVRCLPKDMPVEFNIDVTSMNIGQSKRVKDLSISENIRPLKSLEDVVVVIAKR